MTVVGLSKPARLDALVAALGTELPDTLFDALEDLRPPREHWLDFQRP
jgi:D-threo-aldose 1-dehydrogenase